MLGSWEWFIDGWQLPNLVYRLDFLRKNSPRIDNWMKGEKHIFGAKNDGFL